MIAESHEIITFQFGLSKVSKGQCLPYIFLNRTQRVRFYILDSFARFSNKNRCCTNFFHRLASGKKARKHKPKEEKFQVFTHIQRDTKHKAEPFVLRIFYFIIQKSTYNIAERKMQFRVQQSPTEKRSRSSHNNVKLKKRTSWKALRFPRIGIFSRLSPIVC